MRARMHGAKAVGSLLVLAAFLGACSSGKPHTPAGAPGSTPVVVASFNFAESVLLSDIYAQALQQAGIPVRLELNLGPREMVLPAVRQGMVDLVPEYLGSLLQTLRPDAGLQGASPDYERSLLIGPLDAWKVSVLLPAPAEDQNGLVVTRDLAQKYDLRAISQLAGIAHSLTLGGPAECPSRPYCLLGLNSVYGLYFGHFDSFDAESQRVTALEQRVVDVAVMNTTDGELATDRFVLLQDDRHLQPADNVAPLVSHRAVDTYGPRLVATLNAVSARLTSPDLTYLNWRVQVAGGDPAAEAHAWLVRSDLVPPN